MWQFVTERDVIPRCWTKCGFCPTQHHALTNYLLPEAQTILVCVQVLWMSNYCLDFVIPSFQVKRYSLLDSTAVSKSVLYITTESSHILDTREFHQYRVVQPLHATS